MNFDYTLYLVTDRQLMSCDSLTEAVEQAILGGCTMIQLREKELSSLEFYNQAVAVKQVTDKYHIPLIINDRIDIAMAVQATGVHIGQHDLPAAAVRKVIGENMLLGVSASSIAEAMYGWFCTFRGNQFTRSNPRGKRRIRNTAYSRK